MALFEAMAGAGEQGDVVRDTDFLSEGRPVGALRHSCRMTLPEPTRAPDRCNVYVYAPQGIDRMASGRSGRNDRRRTSLPSMV